jgi:hypothetical protein
MADETVWETREEAVQALQDFRTNQVAPIAKLTRYGQTGGVEEVGLYLDMMRVGAEMQEAVLTQFGRWDKRHPTCVQCRWASVFGGPSHEGSNYCRSGKRAHCSCDLCF